MIPAWWKTPAEAKRSTSQSQKYSLYTAALMISDFVAKAENSGKAEMDAAPMMHSRS